MAERWVLAAAALAALSGIPGLFLDRRSAAGQRLSLALMGAATVLGLAGAALALASPGPGLDPGWALAGGRFTVRADALSAFFLVPIFLMSGLNSLYGLGYWPQEKHPENGRRMRFFYGLVPAGMALTVIARNALLFLTAWEVMTLAGFFLITAEDDDPKVREAGWHYIVATHVGILALMVMFAVLRHGSGTFDLGPVPEGALGSGELAAVFFLAIIGFGLKAGIMPFHVWLPGAHANAPSHVSALLSGVVIKMGIYGLVRVTGWLPVPPLWWGELTLALGVFSGVLGVLFALGQHDIKRLLAYHSIENIGIIVMGLGFALVGRSMGRPEWIVLGLAGGLLHVWNHGLFKSLLFLGAGSVIHATHTREIDHLGGLGRTMPRTAAAFLVGAVAICGLPPLNGFVSELLIYLGLFRAALPGEGTAWAGPAFAAPALALIGALAVACFVKVYGVVFLGEPRSDHARGKAESPASMLAPMAVLAAACFLIGLLPFLLHRVLDPVVASWVSWDGAPASLASLAPLGWVGGAGGVVLAFVAAGFWWAQRGMRRAPPERTVTWDCGYAAPTARMQYTASSFAQMIVDSFAWVLLPRKKGPRVQGPFPAPTGFHSDVPDVVMDRALGTSWGWVEETAGRFRVIQQGAMQMYVLYILATVVALFFWW